MPFMTGDPGIPVLVRLTRNLLVVESAIFFFGLSLYGLTALLTSAGNTSTSTASLSPGGEVILMVIGLVVFGFGAWLVAKLDPLGRWVALGLQVVWFGALVLPSLATSPVGAAIPALLGAAIIALLFTPDVVHAFETAAAGTARSDTVPAGTAVSSSAPVPAGTATSSSATSEPAGAAPPEAAAPPAPSGPSPEGPDEP